MGNFDDKNWGKISDNLQGLISYGKPREFSLSLIDFAAIICSSINPRCGQCPLSDVCGYNKLRVAE